MSYLVLARKWRPTTFSEVVGQAHVTQTIKNAIELTRVAHALLFTGSRGIGKTTCARLLAKALNCVNAPTSDPCGQCSACIEIGQGTSVDVFEIDGASNNSVEQVREIRESVKFTPASGLKKIYIIDEVHMLSTSAFNALLKTLEEPPEHVLFIFATTEPHKIPDTIHSRCQRYDFKRIPERQIVDALQKIADAEGLQIEESALFHVAREAQGGMRDSLSLLDQVIAYCGLQISESQTREVLGIADRSVFSALIKAILAHEGPTALQLISDQFNRGLDLAKFSAELVRYVRDLMVVKICPDAQQLVDAPEDQIESMKAVVSDISPGQIHRLLNVLLKGAEETGRSSFPKLTLEMTVLKLCAQGTTLPLAEVLDGLSRLETSIQSGEFTHTATSPSERSAPSPPITTTTATDPSPEKVSETPRSTLQTEAPTPSVGEVLAAAQVDSSPPAKQHAPGPEELAAEGGEPAAQPEGEKKIAQVDGETKAGQLDGETKAVQVDGEKKAAPEDDSGQGFKKRPAGDSAEYDDLSGTPVSPRPISSLRPLKVKPRINYAIPESEVRPFLAEGRNESTSSTAPTAPEGIEASGVGEADADQLRPPWEPSSESTMEADGRIDLNAGQTPIESFEALIGLIKQNDAFLASELEQCIHLIEFRDGQLRVAVSMTHSQQLGEAGLAVLSEVTKTGLSPEHVLVIETCPEHDDRLKSETIFARRQRLEQEARAARREVAQQAPGVRMAAQVLNAEIVDVQLSTIEAERT